MTVLLPRNIFGSCHIESNDVECLGVFLKPPSRGKTLAAALLDSKNTNASTNRLQHGDIAAYIGVVERRASILEDQSKQTCKDLETNLNN